MGIIQKPEEVLLRTHTSSTEIGSGGEDTIPFIPAFDLLAEKQKIPLEHVAAIGLALWKILGGTSVPPSRWSVDGAAKRT